MNDEQTFESVKARLDEIVDEISQEGVTLDEALALYEEAVKLGLSACDLSEADILPPEDEAQAEAGADATADAAAEGQPEAAEESAVAESGIAADETPTEQEDAPVMQSDDGTQDDF